MARGRQTDMGTGFGRDIDDRIEALANEWLERQTELDEARERKDAAGDLVLARMQAEGVPHYTCSDGTVLSVETTTKVKGKRKKRRKAVSDIEEAANTVDRSIAKLAEGGTKVTIELPRGRGRKPKKGEN